MKVPVPNGALHVPDVAPPPIVPDRDIELLEHTDDGPLTAAVGAVRMVITTVLETAPHKPGLSVVRVSVTEPVDLSPELSV